MTGFYLAMNYQGGDDGDAREYRDEAALVHELYGEEIDPTQIIRIDLENLDKNGTGTARDVSEEIAELVFNRWIDCSDESTIEHGKPPKFVLTWLGDCIDILREDALENIRDERAHVREVSSPEYSGIV